MARGASITGKCRTATADTAVNAAPGSCRITCGKRESDQAPSHLLSDRAKARTVPAPRSSHAHDAYLSLVAPRPYDWKQK